MSCKETLKELLTTTVVFVLPYFIVLICLYLIIFWYDIVVAAENYPDNHKLVCEQADPVATYPLGSAAIARLYYWKSCRQTEANLHKAMFCNGGRKKSSVVCCLIF